MSKITSPKAWYLLGVGALGLALDGTRRLVRRRRPRATAETGAAQPVMPAEVVAEAKKEEKRARQMKAAAPVVEPPVAEPVEPPAVGADDLTLIKGIGPTFARRLNEAGYMSFADLAKASPGTLREVTHAPVMASPEEWIVQARDM